MEKTKYIAILSVLIVIIIIISLLELHPKVIPVKENNTFISFSGYTILPPNVNSFGLNYSNVTVSVIVNGSITTLVSNETGYINVSSNVNSSKVLAGFYIPTGSTIKNITLYVKNIYIQVNGSFMPLGLISKVKSTTNFSVTTHNITTTGIKAVIPRLVFNLSKNRTNKTNSVILFTAFSLLPVYKGNYFSIFTFPSTRYLIYNNLSLSSNTTGSLNPLPNSAVKYFYKDLKSIEIENLTSYSVGNKTIIDIYVKNTRNYPIILRSLMLYSKEPFLHSNIKTPKIILGKNITDANVSSSYLKRFEDSLINNSLAGFRNMEESLINSTDNTRMIGFIINRNSSISLADAYYNFSAFNNIGYELMPNQTAELSFKGNLTIGLFEDIFIDPNNGNGITSSELSMQNSSTQYLIVKLPSLDDYNVLIYGNNISYTSYSSYK